MERDVGCLDQWRVQPFAAQLVEIYSTTVWMLDGDPICTYLDVVASYLAISAACALCLSAACVISAAAARI